MLGRENAMNMVDVRCTMRKRLGEWKFAAFRWRSHHQRGTREHEAGVLIQMRHEITQK